MMGLAPPIIFWYADASMMSAVVAGLCEAAARPARRPPPEPFEEWDELFELFELFDELLFCLETPPHPARPSRAVSDVGLRGRGVTAHCRVHVVMEWTAGMRSEVESARE